MYPPTDPATELLFQRPISLEEALAIVKREAERIEREIYGEPAQAVEEKGNPGTPDEMP